jgi:hypothetical protein|tara:strand:+ start:276 stop:842 length:567 start_codon:yes stop_codon:yes gene_type:complete
MGTLKTTNIQTITGSGTLTLGTSGETLAYGSGVTSNLLYPAWFASLSADQTGVSETTYTKVEFNTVVIDTDNAYNNTTNYRWTCPSGKAGKYKVELSVMLRTASDAVSNLSRCRGLIYKNGSEVAETFNDLRNNYVRKYSLNQSLILDIAEGDYLEGFGWGQSIDAGGLQFMGDAAHESWFLGYRIGT